MNQRKLVIKKSRMRAKKNIRSKLEKQLKSNVKCIRPKRSVMKNIANEKSMAMITHVGIVTKTLHINVVAKCTRTQCIR